MKLMTVDHTRAAEILLVEDNIDDVELTREGFRHSKLLVNLYHVKHGEECLAFLRQQDEYTDVPRPDLILLDLNLPVMDGRELLAVLNEDEDLRRIPVVVLTTSDLKDDVRQMYTLKCSAYAKKPVDFNQFIEVIEGISDFYFTLVTLPPKD